MNNRFDFDCGVSIELDEDKIKVNTYSGYRAKIVEDIYSILVTYKIYRDNNLLYTVWYDSGTQWEAMSHVMDNSFNKGLVNISYELLGTKWSFMRIYADEYAINIEEYDDNIVSIITREEELYRFANFLQDTHKKIIYDATHSQA